MESEIWKPIVGYENLYAVSNKGAVKRINRFVLCKNGERRVKNDRNCKIFNNGFGYSIVSLWKEGKQKTMTVHRLVAIAFLHKEPHQKCVNHKNGVRNDNRVENLEWCTHSENAKHAFDVLGRDKRSGQNMGGENPWARPIKCVETGECFDSVATASRKLNMPISTIYKSLYKSRKTKVGLSFIGVPKNKK